MNTDDLLRGSPLTWGHIQLFRDKDGWQASVCHYEPRKDLGNDRFFDDPVKALQHILAQDQKPADDGFEDLLG